MAKKRTYTPIEVFRMLGISKTTGYQQLREQRIPGWKLGGRWVIPAASFDRWLEQGWWTELLRDDDPLDPGSPAPVPRGS